MWPRQVATWKLSWLTAVSVCLGSAHAQEPASGQFWETVTPALSPPVSKPMKKRPPASTVQRTSHEFIAPQLPAIPGVELPEPAPLPPPLSSRSATTVQYSPPPVPPSSEPDVSGSAREAFAPPAAITPVPEFSNSTEPFVSSDCLPGQACDASGGFLEDGQFINGQGRKGFLAPYLNLGVKAGDRVIGDGRLFIPLRDSIDGLLFSDLRIQYDDNDAVEGNFGLGWRKMYDEHWILGLYAYYDLLESPFGNTFNQATLGAELLTLDWDFRINGYLPELGGKFVNSQAALVNGNIVLNNFEERAYRGLDAEVGYRLFYWGVNDDFEVRLFGGGFMLENDAAGFSEISGPRARLEFRAYDLELFGTQSRLEAGIETTYDRVRNEQFYGFARLRIPLYGGSVSKLTPLRRRFADLPVRDQDIVTQRGLASRERALNNLTGQELGDVHLVDGNRTIAQAVAEADEGDVIIVSGDWHTTPFDDTIALKTGQSLIGGGTRLVIAGKDSGRIDDLILPGTRPTLTPDLATVQMVEGADLELDPIITLADNTLIQGINFAGADEAIFGDQVNEVLVRDVKITGSYGTAIDIRNSGDVVISQAYVEDTRDHALRVVDSAGIYVDSSKFDDTGRTAIVFDGVQTGMISRTRIHGVGRPTGDDPQGRIDPAIHLTDSSDVSISRIEVKQAARGLLAEDVRDTLYIKDSRFDLTDPDGEIPEDAELAAIEINRVGSEAAIGLHYNEIVVNRAAGQTGVLLSLHETNPAPFNGTEPVFVDLRGNAIKNLSGQGIVIDAEVDGEIYIDRNSMELLQIGLPGGLPTGNPATVQVTAEDSQLKLFLRENRGIAGTGAVEHQPLTSAVSAFNSQVELNLSGNHFPIDFLSIFRDVSSAFEVDTNTGNDFPLKLAPGSQPVTGVNP